MDALFAIVKQATAVPDEVRLNQLAVRKSDFGHRLTDLEVNRAIFSTGKYCFKSMERHTLYPVRPWRSREGVALCLVSDVCALADLALLGNAVVPLRAKLCAFQEKK